MSRPIHEQLVELQKTCAFSPVVPYEPGQDSAVCLDLSVRNQALKGANATPAAGLQEFVNEEITKRGANIGYGGYLEERALYGSSEHFGGAEPRNIHLGVDIWVPAGTPIFAPIEGRVHSFRNNTAVLDYGPTIILEHDLGGRKIHSLYGHLTRTSLEGLIVGKVFSRGDRIALLGAQTENGGWPPHLHFQLIVDMGEWRGDYPGVGERSKLDYYRENCPDPGFVLPWSR